eukprot:m.156140 g.156140  ORF g.156140 m.156140 type:complete len:685 (-) comp15095_c0_seq4:2457-4511(-)
MKLSLRPGLLGWRSLSSCSVQRGQNIVEKIAGKHSVGVDPTKVRSLDYVTVKPAFVMTHDNTAAVMNKFKELKLESVANPRQMVFTLDHNVQDKSEANLKKYSNISQFAEHHDIDFYPAGRGIGHQVLCEEGYALPNTMVVASDSHSNMYGGVACLGTPVVRTDAACLWATGQTWWQVPMVAKVELTGTLNPGVYGKDVIIALCGAFSKDEVLNHAIEFSGDGIANLSIDERLTIANMTTEWGAMAGIFPFDDKLEAWLEQRSSKLAKRGFAKVPSDVDSPSGTQNSRLNERSISSLDRFAADSDAVYQKTLVLDLSSVEPHVSGPNSVKTMNPVSTLEKQNIPIQKAYLVSCVNSRKEDLHIAAEVVKGKKIAEGVEFYVAAASSEVQRESEESGDWDALMEAGATPLPPGCGPCIGLGKGILKDGEVGISATNRNFKGRMGSKEASAYLASPAIVAHSALLGKIAGDPKRNTSGNSELQSHIVEGESPEIKSSVTLTEGFQPVLKGPLVFVSEDNINTDGIYAGKHTYHELSPEDQAKVVMENYDESFKSLAKPGDILVGGFNFGTGSSREQAATALKHAGIRAVVVGSVNETYKRNALNNGLLILEVPNLARDLQAIHTNATTALSETLEIDFTKSEAHLIDTDANTKKTYSFAPLGEVAQELIIIGGLENWVVQNAKNQQ